MSFYTRQNAPIMAATLAYNIMFGLLFAFLYIHTPSDTETALRARLRMFALLRTESTAFSLYGTVNAFPVPTRLKLFASKHKALDCLQVIMRRWLVPLPWHLFCMLIKCIIIYPIVGLRCCVGHFLVFYLALCAQRLGNTAMGLMLATMTCNPILSTIINGCGFVFNVLVSGTFYVTDTVSWVIRWVEFLSPSYYVAEMMAQNELGGLDDNIADKILGGVQFDQIGEWTAFILLLALTATFMAVCFVVLWVGSLRRWPKIIIYNTLQNNI